MWSYDAILQYRLYANADAKNLKTKHYSSGAAISQGYRDYNDKYYLDMAIQTIMNKLDFYTWAAVMNAAGQ